MSPHSKDCDFRRRGLPVSFSTIQFLHEGRHDVFRRQLLSRNSEERRLPRIECEAEVICPPQIFLRAQIEYVARIRQCRFNFDWFLQGFIAAGLFQVFAHLIIDVPLEGD